MAPLLAATRLELLQGLIEQGSTVFVAAPLLHVGKVRLVRLVAHGARWRLGLLSCGEAAFGTVPGIRHGCVSGKSRAHLVTVRAKEGDPLTRSRFASLLFAHWTGA